ncbi:hypothetical protein I4I73_06575 [Pseudonocardia sp. KRD-184]|uniref:Uncharacterized protein n=1 Tax=Pseudonocardia oceani TaxID=2792013 RepID=A0ABS6U2Z6_9PSEU|nr:hypothetical protein [Pseudonocardia oceani]MBW0088725.1 hypothetical protein [Pseudonocardia oceani]MBW0095664.1 hypothetical protein [Pseudonocardia oceani]MBW0121849.1 hypothetical protein [Pseudonocardia oceani]MBW0126595.1 hypothetical protein [Pseudonocardia oceani]
MIGIVVSSGDGMLAAQPLQHLQQIIGLGLLWELRDVLAILVLSSIACRWEPTGRTGEAGPSST